MSVLTDDWVLDNIYGDNGVVCVCVCVVCCLFFQAEDGIRDLVRSRGLADVYKRQVFQVRHAGGELEGRIRSHRILRIVRETGDRNVRRLSLIHI